MKGGASHTGTVFKGVPSYPNGSRGTTPVLAQPARGAKLASYWLSPLYTKYPNNVLNVTRAGTNPSAQVLPQGQDQAIDPRSQFSGLWDISALSNSGAAMGGGTVIGGSTLNVSSGISPILIILLFGVVALFIWK
jgi:hypothetical protein